MYIDLKKIKEDDVFVYYKFTTQIVAGSYVNSKGAQRMKLQRADGYCQFNKLTEDFILDSSKSHGYFQQKENWEVNKIFLKLLYLKRNQIPFPDDFEIAVG
jgi:hypothetical protein